ncbi:hypothetical protein CLUG_05909 [Clavispora lusitaniae ATCC 42720]|uniref:Phospholipase D1 n=1 Tax=Clavispora lusitaniae (strain ATCC 42720) TaxID=306902 RepID=C4YC92_CLAL4|nr:uncharacterized protein CLUG_05909 [Clavispora lusitaniae ATCC 42720]EEQ41781.1 hypothetical protein CLUG_05909 [Clavispora lusitaniae ATCC 42720]
MAPHHQRNSNSQGTSMKSEESEEGVDKRNGSFFSRFEPVSPTRHHHSGRKSPNQDDAKSIGNAFQFRIFGDPKESRYNSEEDQQKGEVPFTPDESENVLGDSGNEPREATRETEPGQLSDFSKEMHKKSGQSFSAMKRPSFFTRGSVDTSAFNKQGSNEGAADDKGSKPRNIFTIFRKKNKDKDRKHAHENAEDDISLADEDAETRERAQGLISALVMGGPAISLLASCLCEDEFGIARAPLLLNLLGIKVTDISRSPLTKNRKFRIDLEYGVSDQRMRWSVEKNTRDLLYLHSKFKWSILKGSLKSELPHFPVPPSLKRSDRKQKKLNKQKQRSSISERLDGFASEPNNSSHDFRSELQNAETDNQSLMSNQSFRDRLSTLRAHLSTVSSNSSTSSASPEQLRVRILNNQRYLTEITKYLNDLTSALAMRPQSNILFHFFEVSPISALLSYETGYTGKQGVIHVGGSAKSQGWRVGHFKANDLKGMIDRRSEKWFLVRNTYVMYVSDINSTTPLEVFIVDPYFKIHYKGDNDNRGFDSESDYEEEYFEKKIVGDENTVAQMQNKVFKHLRIVLENNERKLVIIPKSKREQKLWLDSLNEMLRNNIWAEKHRFGSFAPVRKNCFAQWFVDARDYFWAVSSAIEMAKDVIFIHDWWLSPELYLRRPANGNQQFRIDRLLQRKAQQGVKVFVIVYRNVGTTIPIDSLYTKHSILSLDQENIHVIRSPNQLLQNTYFWAHHEKICIVDYTVAFLGGIDLCYGRYDTPDHVLADDSHIDFSTLDPETYGYNDFSEFRVFPGKDYSNTRVKDFNNLDKPYETIYDRKVVPRMPWHDIHMVTSGQVARDLSRSFVQRWNYLLRQKRPSRLTPLLTPPPDMTEEEVKSMGLDGTCEVQIVRSAGNWSLGLKEHEESIHQAYLKLIEESEHFVYIENQFFVTSCVIDGTEIKNRIGDALVDRIIRAHKEGKTWKAIIIIPLFPGFESQVDEANGSSVRVVMQCEYMSISRGSSSLFAKLRKYGIDPDNYIQFFSLRKWGILGPDRSLVTEQLYIHAKCMIVDDRVAIIGSANINERSMRGVRDSEVAAVVRDSETIETTMDGESYTVGRFPHTLRLRLMREHLGISVDTLDVVERQFEKFQEFAKTPEGLEAATCKFKKQCNLEISAAVEMASRFVLGQKDGTPRWKHFRKLHNPDARVFDVPIDFKTTDGPEPKSLPLSFNNRTGPHEANKGIRDKKKHSYDARVQNNTDHKRDVYGIGHDKYRTNMGTKGRLDSARFLRQLSKEVMETNPGESFLPDIASVEDFLNSDDHELSENMNEESEEVLSKRDRERWILLKKISYLQRVAAIQTKQKEEESMKRVNAGLPPSIYDQGSEIPEENEEEQFTTTMPVGGETANERMVKGQVVDALEVKQEGPTENGKKDDANEASETSNIEFNESIPVVSLDNSQLREAIQSVNSPGVDNFAKFIDPYCFEDPLDPDFYEDIWFENARRNSEIFRMIFHVQPDDFVANWKEYKRFMKLEEAFKLSQIEEAKLRRGKFRYHRNSSSSSNERPELSHNRRNSQATINIGDYLGENGILGEIPTGLKGDADGPRRRFTVTDTIAEAENEENEEVGDDDDTDDEIDEDDDDNEHENGDAKKVPKSTSNNEEGDTTPEMDRNKTDHVPSEKKQTKTGGHKARKRRAGTFSARRKIHAGERIFERDTAQRILEEIHGHLVLFPVDWLSRELEGGNWFFNTDRIPPIEIYD